MLSPVDEGRRPRAKKSAYPNSSGSPCYSSRKNTSVRQLKHLNVRLSRRLSLNEKKPNERKNCVSGHTKWPVPEICKEATIQRNGSS